METTFDNVNHSTISFADICKATDGTIGKIFTWNCTNGAKIQAKRKVTTRAGLIATNYVHAIITDQRGYSVYWREQKNGMFKPLEFGKGMYFKY